MTPHFPYLWNLSDGYPAAGIDYHGCKVFGTFLCGGGSSMGYKLSGFDHLGGVEIDQKMAAVYQVNHHPKYLYNDDIRLFKASNDLPDELFNIDILDGSPPCSSFSLAGNREEDWGREKMFAEGQALQTLDDLFFDFIDLADKLRPKVAVAENVAGLVAGNARAYVHDICKAFKKIGYAVQVFFMNASSMGVPQRRERIFFICHREDLALPKLKLQFDQKPIVLGEVEKHVANPIGVPLTEAFAQWWRITKNGDSFGKAHPIGSFFNSRRMSRSKVITTITATVAGKVAHYEHPNELHDDVFKLCGTFPVDYDFMDVPVKYLIGMSVPPVMMANISHQVYNQWLRMLK